MTDKRKSPAAPVQEELARTIAEKIIKRQSQLAAFLNRQVNQYSKTRQKWFLVIFCSVSLITLILRIVLHDGSQHLNQPGRNYQPMHIGQPTNKPGPKRPRLTDSTTLIK